MTLGHAFWVLVLVAVVFFGLVHFALIAGAWALSGVPLLFFVLLILLGWQVFGPPLHK